MAVAFLPSTLRDEWVSCSIFMKIIFWIFWLPVFLNAQGIVFETPFESTSEWSVDGNTANNIWETNQYIGTLVGDAYQGSSAVRLAALPTEIRNEFNINPIIEWDEEYWIGFAFKITVDTDNLRPFIQMRQAPGSSKNAFTMRCVDGGDVRIDTLTDPLLADATPGSGASNGAEFTYFPRNLGQWHVVVINFNFHYLSGHLQVWIDGNLLVDENNTTTIYRRDEFGVILPGLIYAKIGPYPGSVADKIGTIDYDGYKIWEGVGGSYEDVHPLGLSPEGGSQPEPSISPKNILGSRRSTLRF